jgi:thiosulfate dehydrogenase [quinone] large subunit
MATTQPRQTANTFRSTVAGITVTGRAHPLSAWFVLALRLMMGWAFFVVAPDILQAGGAERTPRH